MTQKPMSIVRKEFMDNLSKLVNESGLSPYILEPIVAELLNAIHINMETQYQQESAQYEESLKAESVPV